MLHLVAALGSAVSALSWVYFVIAASAHLPLQAAMWDLLIVLSGNVLALHVWQKSKFSSSVLMSAALGSVVATYFAVLLIRNG